MRADVRLAAGLVLLAALVAGRVDAADVFLLDPEPNEGLTGGVAQRYTDADGPFQAQLFAGDHDLLSVGFIGPEHAWFGNFGSPIGASLAPGYYDDTSELNARAPSLDVAGDGRGCTAVGRFFVFELVVSDTGDVQKFAADFEQRCNEFGPALYGSVRFNSDVPIARPCKAADEDNDGEADATDRCAGTPTGEIVDDAGCSVAQYCGAIDVSTPAGRRFCRTADWLNDAHTRAGASRDCIVARDPTGRRYCAARPPTSRPLVTLDVGGDPGDYVTGGVTYHVTSADASVSARGSFLPGLAVLSGLQVFASAELDGVGHFWDILLGAPSGTPLAPGTYEGTARFPSTDMPLLDVGGDGRGCNTATGSFDLDDVAVSRYGAVDRLAVSFEQHCEGGVPALRGSLSFARRIRYGLTCLDQDGDGEPDPTDRCPGTPSGVPVDDAGCSHDQFCTMIDVSADHGVRCAHADWRGDSPRHRDCIVTADGCRARP